jgi:hypothetical protein
MERGFICHARQFRYISSLRTRFQREGFPIISVDTKKRELVGNFKNNGVKWDRTSVRVNDHDFRSDAIGVAIPYGIYDLLANRGSVFVGVSHDTAAFAVHSIAGWWKRDGGDRWSTMALGGATTVVGSSSSWPTPVAATVAVPAPGKPNCKANSATALGSPSLLPITLPGLLNGIPSNTDCSPKSPKTGPLSLLTATPKSSISSATPAPEPA